MHTFLKTKIDNQNCNMYEYPSQLHTWGKNANHPTSTLHLKDSISAPAQWTV